MSSETRKVVAFPTTRLRAFARSLCPRCRSGRIFASFLAMNPGCPSCGLVFEREPGYFSGALFISHLAGLPLIVLLAGVAILWLGPDASMPLAILLATLSFSALSPFLCRVARVLWIHLDQNLDPARRPLSRPRRRFGVTAAGGSDRGASSVAPPHSTRPRLGGLLAGASQPGFLLFPKAAGIRSPVMVADAPPKRSSAETGTADDPGGDARSARPPTTPLAGPGADRGRRGQIDAPAGPRAGKRTS